MHEGRGIGWGGREKKREKICESECGVALTILILYNSCQDVNTPHYGRGLTKTARMRSARCRASWGCPCASIRAHGTPCAYVHLVQRSRRAHVVRVVLWGIRF